MLPTKGKWSNRYPAPLWGCEGPPDSMEHLRQLGAVLPRSQEPRWARRGMWDGLRAVLRLSVREEHSAEGCCFRVGLDSFDKKMLG